MTLAGQIGLVPKAKTPFQKIIEFITRSPVHHAVIAIDDETCVSAELPVVRTRPISHYPHAYWSHFNLTPTQRHDVVSFAKRQLGRPYSLFDDFLIAIALITKHRTPKWLVRRLMSDRRWQCAELTDASYIAAGIDLFAEVPQYHPPCAVYPGSFIPVFKRRGWYPRRPPWGTPPWRWKRH